METDLKELGDRLQRLEKRYAVAQDRRETEAEKAAKALASISDASIEMLRSVVPTIGAVAKYTKEQILLNEHNEVNEIKNVCAQLQSYLEARLKFYEESL